MSATSTVLRDVWHRVVATQSRSIKITDSSSNRREPGTIGSLIYFPCVRGFRACHELAGIQNRIIQCTRTEVLLRGRGVGLRIWRMRADKAR